MFPAQAFIVLRTASKLMPIIAYTHLPKLAPFSKTFEAEQSGFSQCQSWQWCIMSSPRIPRALQSVFPLLAMMLVEGRMDVFTDGSL